MSSRPARLGPCLLVWGSRPVWRTALLPTPTLTPTPNQVCMETTEDAVSYTAYPYATQASNPRLAEDPRQACYRTHTFEPCLGQLPALGRCVGAR